MDYPLRDTMPFYFVQISGFLSDIFNQSLAEFDITIPMYRVLVALQDGHSRMLNQIAQTLDVEQSTLSRQITTMVKSGLVSRTRPDENGRIVQIEITAHGRDVVEKMIPVAQNLEMLAIGDCSAEEIEETKRVLRKIHANVRKI
jgi:DNA-binding MarR family transcriptional regulator